MNVFFSRIFGAARAARGVLSPAASGASFPAACTAHARYPGYRRCLFRTLSMICAFILFLFPALTGCSRADSADEETASSASEDFTDSLDIDSASDTDADAETMEFTDVRGETHTLVIDPDAEENDYDRSCFAADGEKMTYTSSACTARLGVDVSYYQGEIDWDAVYADGYTFAFIRIGFRGYGEEGTLVEDEAFRTNLEAAQAAGLDVGVYFYAQAVSAEEAAEEAAFVLDILDGAQLELPVVYDPEYVLDEDGNQLEEARTTGVDGAQITENTLTFCAAVEDAGYESAFYSNMLSESEVFDMAALSAYTVWYADYEDAPQTPYAFSFWQYSDTGSVDGIEGTADLNIWLIPAE